MNALDSTMFTCEYISLQAISLFSVLMEVWNINICLIQIDFANVAYFHPWEVVLSDQPLQMKF